MSPSWNDRILAALRPDKVILLRLSRGLRPAVKENAIISCPANAQTPHWQSAADALAATLQHKGWRHARIDIVLSQHFVRSAMLPANLMLKSRDEEHAYARHCLVQANDELMGDWKLCLSNAPPHVPKLICAMEAELLDTLGRIASASANRLMSVRPLFAAAFDSRRSVLSKQHAWFITTELDQCCMLRLQHGVLRAVSGRRIFRSLEEEMPTFLEHERLLDELGDMPRKVFLVAPESRWSLARMGQYSVNALPTVLGRGLSMSSDAVYGLAMEAGA